MKLLTHPASQIFPMMGVDEFESLKASIKENGLQNPITTFEGQILDGRNRHKACLELGVDPKFIEFQRNGIDEYQFIAIENGQRRNLAVGQKACSAVLYKIDLSKRKDFDKTLKLNYLTGEKCSNSTKIASKILGVGTRAIDRAYRLHREHRSLFKQVFDGKLTLNAAYLKHVPAIRRGTCSAEEKEMLKKLRVSSASNEGSLKIPSVFDGYETIHEFVANMGAKGWSFDSTFMDNSWRGQFYGKGIAVKGMNKLTPCRDFKQAVVCAAKEIL